jgi:hypothetical protein
MESKYCCGYGGAKMGADNGWIGPALTVGLIGGLAYLSYQFFTGNSSLSPGAGTTANNSAITTSTASTSQAAVTASTAAGIKQTIPDSTLNGYVTAITNTITPADSFPLDENTSQTVQNIVCQVNTKTDWYRLVQLFGTKNYNGGGSQSLCSWFAIDCQQADLPGLLKVALQPDVLSNINTYFADTFGDTEVQI